MSDLLKLKSMDYSVLQQCMHCGLCLPDCPTYVETGMERNSPRGRIAWMRAIADGDMAVDRDFADEMSYCLGCLACTSACPAGVDYAQLFEAARTDIETTQAAGGGERVFWRWLALKWIFSNPRLLRFVGKVLRIYQKSGLAAFLRKQRFFGLLPAKLRELEPQTPIMADRFSNQLIRPVEKPLGEKRHRVAVLTGCVQDLAFSDINRDTVDVLLANGCEVVTPPVQPCCGSLHAHNGAMDLARALARRQLELFDVENLDAIITNAGGCGSHLKQYGHLLEDDADYAARAKAWDAKCMDIHEWLVAIHFRKPTSTAIPRSVTYHESCHLCHGQKVTRQPREILNAIPGITLTELAESNWCCGSAGIYNITQPEQSAKLLDRKMEHIKKSGARMVATSNPGCHLQIQSGIARCGLDISVRQPVSLLAAAYRAEITHPS